MKFKFIISILLLLSFIQQLPAQNDKSYEDILNGLNLSYVNYSSKIENEEDFLELFRTNKEQFIKDRLIYEKALVDFFNSDINLINYLLKFEDVNEICKWVETHNPISSSINNTIVKNFSALILIDNFLTPDKKEISVSKNKISYSKLRRFLRRNEKCDLDELRIKYQEKLRKK
jgi:hypothetical protein